MKELTCPNLLENITVIDVNENSNQPTACQQNVIMDKIKRHANESFEDDNCTLSWMLRFEFVISASGSEPITR